MAYWIFKVASQELYPDEPGKKYIYDNTHSVRVKPGDTFMYLSKEKQYSFTGTGIVKKIAFRNPTVSEAKRTARVRTVFIAYLSDIIWFTSPLSISPIIKKGKQNRSRLGIIDVNLLGWSQSIPSLGESMYKSILDLAEIEDIFPASKNREDFNVPDSWGITKIRGALKRFSDPVLKRSNSKCVICGTSLPGLVEAGHIIPYASDHNNRANPANGIALCKYCHCAFDLRLIAIQNDGELLVAPSIDKGDKIAALHFSRVDKKERLEWLQGVDHNFLEIAVQWYKDNLAK